MVMINTILSRGGGAQLAQTKQYEKRIDLVK